MVGYPLVLHVPHSSVSIPDSVRAQLLLSDEELNLELLRMTDRYTDDIFNVAGVDKIVYPVSRLVVDPERFEDDEFEDMSKIGMGAVYTVTSHLEKLRNPIAYKDREYLLDEYYRPHHQRLSRVVSEILDVHGRALVIDCHSFPNVALPYEPDQSDDRPDICLGSDDFHTPNSVLMAANNLFREEGFRVAINRPFSGALVPIEYYRKSNRVGSIMIEINRKLYMNESTGEKLAGFRDVNRKISIVIEEMAKKFSET